MEKLAESLDIDVEVEQDMGKVVTTIEIINGDDEGAFRRGTIPESAIRRVKLEALVDTGSTALSISESDILKLGLPIHSEVISRFANGQTVKRKVYGPANLVCMKRKVIAFVLGGFPNTPALLGQIPLEALDFHIDPTNRRLIPNPDSPDMPLYHM